MFGIFEGTNSKDSVDGEFYISDINDLLEKDKKIRCDGKNISTEYKNH